VAGTNVLVWRVFRFGLRSNVASLKTGEFKPTDPPELQMDALHCPCFFRWWQGGDPVLVRGPVSFRSPALVAWSNCESAVYEKSMRLPLSMIVVGGPKGLPLLSKNCNGPSP
jgi:hypothetical protein